MRPKRSLGQNFLLNSEIATRIAEFAALDPIDTVLEIGPGRGVLTMVLSGKVGSVVAVEKDDGLYRLLADDSEIASNVRLVHGDILEMELEGLVPRWSKLVANLPYNIVSKVLMKLVNNPGYFSEIVIMVQKEVGLRICADPGSHTYSALSVIAGIVFNTVPGFIVGPKNFYPRPKVDSMVLKLLPKQRDLPDDMDMSLFKKVVFACFSFRRKMLKNSLVNLDGVDQVRLEEIARIARIDLTSRPQALSPGDFYRIARVYKRIQQT